MNIDRPGRKEVGEALFTWMEGSFYYSLLDTPSIKTFLPFPLVVICKTYWPASSSCAGERVPHYLRSPNERRLEYDTEATPLVNKEV